MRLFFLAAMALGLSTTLMCAPAAVSAQEEAEQAEESPKPKPKKKTKKKGYDYEKSKYKAFRVDPGPRIYRFDSKGNPILPEQKKTPAKKQPLSLPDEEEGCRSEGSCADGAAD